MNQPTLAPATFQTLIAANKRRSGFLVVAMLGLAALAGAVIPTALLGQVSPAAMIGGALLAVALGGFGALIGYYKGASIVMAVSGATPLNPADDRELQNVVEEIAIAAGVAPPKIYLIDDSAPNAFATGRDPRHAAIAVTTGLRSKLNREELQAVIAHEFGHIVNYDIRLMMITAVLAGAIVLLCDFFWRALRFGGPRGRSDRKSGGAAQVVFLVLALALALLAPVVAKLVQLAVSRQREFLADATSVRLTRNPNGLVTALLKLSSDPDPLEAANRATEHLYIVSPTRKLTDANRDSIWSTHPPINKRIQRIRALLD
ncbi:MAG: M48 family metallopeptidase [Oligoflexia bacterium]|nr:M48 family metallopeptidase [Oligoflexia bacterium]